MNTFLFSVDLEDVRLRMKDGLRYAERVPKMTRLILEFLEKHNVRCTFFVVGDVAELYPALIREIHSKGHEIACHSASHILLDKMSEEQFRADLKKNIDSLKNAGTNEISGYRAPVFSLTEKTKWAYSILAEFGFMYSSSVLPAANPFYGWNDFGSEIKRMDGLLEIPMSVSSFFGKKIPFAGGIYFRVLPLFMIRNSFRQHFKKYEPVIGYFHPYDIDTEQERYMHPGINNNHFYNYLIYYNRSSVFNRLEKIFKECTVLRYCDFAKGIK